MSNGLAWPDMVFDYLVILTAVCFVVLLLVCRGQTRYLPGPRGLPLLGVALQHPRTEYWKTYVQWGKQYGMMGLISFHILGRRMVVINSRKAAEALLDAKGYLYSDRPFPMMSGHLMKRHKSIFIMSYTDRLKAYRKLMHHDFNSRAAQKYWPIQEQEAHTLLRNLMETPEKFLTHINRYSGALIMKLAFGYEVKSENDYYLQLAEESMKVGSLAAAPGRWLVDSFPILRFLPSWFPGASFKRKAVEMGNQLYLQTLEPHNYVKKELAAGTAMPSFTSQYLATEGAPPPTAEFEDLVLWTAGALYTGGYDTTSAAIRAFVLAMTLYPDIQKLAQRELDSVIGSHRLPRMSDRGSLPFIDAIIKEILRWATISPMGLPHATAAEDEVLGYKIPKGCVVMVNLWAMLHDETVYPEPFKFDPTRFLGANQQADPRELAFGRGRRSCPGQHIAESSVFIEIAFLLAAFHIRKSVDEAGNEIEPKVAFTTGIVSTVQPFACKLVLRNAEILTLIENEP